MKIRRGERGEEKPCELRAYPGILSFRSEGKTIFQVRYEEGGKIEMIEKIIGSMPAEQLGTSPKLVAFARMILSLASDGSRNNESRMVEPPSDGP